MATTNPITGSPVVSGTTPLPTSSSSGSSSSLDSSTGTTLAGNFQTFLSLLTTQLQNQNPLDPLDTNQFTQQLVEFASVEQQLKTNDQLTTLVSLQQSTQATQALGFVGKTAVVNGNTTALSNSSATWQLDVPSSANVSITIANSTHPGRRHGQLRRSHPDAAAFDDQRPELHHQPGQEHWRVAHDPYQWIAVFP